MWLQIQCHHQLLYYIALNGMLSFPFVFFSPCSNSLTVLFYFSLTMSFFPWELISLSSFFMRLQNIINLNFRKDSGQGGSWFAIYCPRKSLVIPHFFAYSSSSKKTFIVPTYEFVSPSSYVNQVSDFCLLLQLSLCIFKKSDGLIFILEIITFLRKPRVQASVWWQSHFKESEIF